MANGFTQRFRGKITAQSIWANGSQQYGAGAYVAYSTAGTQTLGLERLSAINAASAASVFTLGGMPVAGLEKILDLTVSSGVFIKAAAGSCFDPSTNTVFKSTYAQRLTLIGISSVAWRIRGVYPDTTAGGAPVGGGTLSTTT